MPRSLNTKLNTKLMFVAGCLLMLVAYWPGLHGGFLLDDGQNFVQLERFELGQVEWIGPVVSNGSGPLGRPISMASFVATVAAGGHDPWAYKVGNLFLHLSIGALMGIFALLCVRREPRFTNNPERVAIFIALAWMLLPIHVSTVLYPVQRMAQMSALFLVLGLIAYVTLRQRLIDRPNSRRLMFGLIASVVGFTVLGALSKENGLLLPLLCLAVEVTLFADAARGRRPAAVALLLTLGLPMLAGVIVALLYHERLFGSYDTRSFSMVERLLTEPRVLWDYVWNVFVPSGARLGIYQDDFPISRSLWNPATTLPAIVAWLGLLAAAIYCRRSMPVAACGLLLFLGGHAMESSIFPLEIYFEHRNYLPAIGLLLIATALGFSIAARLPPATRTFRHAMAVLPSLVLLVLGVAVYGRSLVWGSPETLMAQSEANRPLSPRVQSNLAARAMQQGDLAQALAHIDAAELLTGPSELGSTALWRIIAHCQTRHAIDAALIVGAERNLQVRPTTWGLRAAIVLAELAEAGECPGFDPAVAFKLYARWADSIHSPPRSHAAWRIRYLAARLAAGSRNWEQALGRGVPAWEDSKWNTGVGIFLIQVANSAKNRETSMRLLERLRQTAPDWDRQLRDAIQMFQTRINESAGPASPGT